MDFSIIQPYYYQKNKDMKLKWNGNKINHNRNAKPDFKVYSNGVRFSRYFHPEAIPLSIAIEFVNYMSDEGDLVLDAFTGSGTVLEACKILDRNYIGVDISEKYIEMAKFRIRNDDKKLDEYINNE